LSTRSEQEVIKNRFNPLFYSALIVFILLFLAEIFLMTKLNPYPCEDAYITYQFSRNFAEGAGPVFNPGNRVEGYSNFVWMSLIAFAHKSGIRMTSFSVIGGWIFNILSLFLVWYIPVRHFSVKGVISLFGPLLYLLFLPLHFYAASGLETPFYSFLLLLCINLILYSGKKPFPFALTGLIFLLIALTRPEGIIFAIFWGAYLIWNAVFKGESIKPYLPGISVLITGYAVFILWRLSYYGLPLPNTYYAKGSFPFSLRLMIGAITSKSFWSQYLHLPLIFLTLIGFVKFKEKKAAALFAFAAAGIFFSMGFSGFDWMPFFRYTLPIVPPIIILCQIIFGRHWENIIKERLLKRKLIWGLVTLFFISLAGLQYYNDLTFNLRWKWINDFAMHNQKFFGSWVKNNLGKDPVIAIGDIGRIAYFSEATIIDIYGLAHKKFAALKKEYGTPDINIKNLTANFDTYKKKETELLLEVAPDYICFYNAKLKIFTTYTGSASGITESPEFKKKYTYMTTFSVIPRHESRAWPELPHYVDILDLSAGLLAWIENGWGYDIYIRKDSPYPPFIIESDPDGKIINIIKTGKTEG